MVRGIRPEPIPRLGDRDRSRSRKGAPDVAIPFKDRGGSGVVGGAEDHRDLCGGEPPGDRELRRPQRRHERRHLLPEDGGGTFDAAAVGAYLAG